MNSLLPKENINAHTKKLRYLLAKIEAKIAKLSRGKTNLLDFGCGNGTAVSQYLMLDEVDYLGVDIHQPSLDYANAHFSGEKRCFIDHIPTNNRFDIIIYADILEHLDDPVGILREHNDFLNDDGIIVGAVPNGYGPFENEKRLSRWLGLNLFLDLLIRVKHKLVGKRHHSVEQIPYNSDSGHVQFFTHRTLFKALDDAGFVIQDFSHGSFLGAPLSERFILRGERIAKLNAWVADYLPYWVVSTWYFTAVKKNRQTLSK